MLLFLPSTTFTSRGAAAPLGLASPEDTLAVLQGTAASESALLGKLLSSAAGLPGPEVSTRPHCGLTGLCYCHLSRDKY